MKPKQPELVFVVFRDLSPGTLRSFLRIASIWMIDSPANRAALDRVSRETDLLSLPGEISLISADGPPSAGFLYDLVEEINGHHNGSLWTQWRRIIVSGIQLTADARARLEQFGVVRETRGGFVIGDDARDPLPSDEQRASLGMLIQRAFVEIRALGAEGHGQQASDLADAFHNISAEMYGWGGWSIRNTRELLERYQLKYHREDYSPKFDYVSDFDDIFRG